MLKDIQSALKLRTITVLLIVHVGLICGIFALARLSVVNGWDETTFWVLGALVGLYGGFIIGALFILLPVLPWIRRAQKVDHWTERLVRDIPIVLQYLPEIIAAFQKLVQAWHDAKENVAQATSPKSTKHEVSKKHS